MSARRLVTLAVASATLLGSALAATPAYATAPAAPDSVTAHQHEPFMNISWTPPADTTGITGYQTCWSTAALPADPSGLPDCLGAAANESSAQADVGTPGTYNVGVWSFNEALEFSSRTSTSAEFIDPNNQPSVSVTSVTATSIGLSWTAISGVSNYGVVYKPFGAVTISSPTDGTVVAPSGLTASLTGLSSSSPHTYHVYPLTADGGWGQPYEGTTTTLPGAVQNLTATPNAAGNGSVALSWSAQPAHEDQEGFRILKKLGSAPAVDCAACIVTTVFNTSATGTTVTLAQLGGAPAMGRLWYFGVAPTFYTYGVGALATTSTSTWSTQALQPQEYYSDAYRSGSDYRMIVHYAAPSQPNWTALKIFRATGTAVPTDGGTPLFSCTKAANNCGTSRTFTGLTNGAKYTFSVYTYDAAGHKARVYWTDTARATGMYLNGSWLPGTLIPHYYGNIELVVDAAGNQSAIYPRMDGLYFGRKQSGAAAFTWAKIPGTAAGDNYPVLVTRSNNTLVLGFNRYTASPTTSGPFIMTRAYPSAWTAPARIAGASTAYSFQDLVRDSANVTHVVMTKYSSPGGVYYVKGNPGAWGALARVAGTTNNDYPMLTVDSSRKRIGLAFTRDDGSAAAANGVYTAIKAYNAGAFPTPTKRAGTNGLMDPVGFTILGTRAIVYIQRYGGATPASGGPYQLKATAGGTAAAPTLTAWGAAPSRIPNTSSRDSMRNVAMNSNGETALAFYRGTQGQADYGIYVMRSATTGVFSTAGVRKTSNVNDYVSDLTYISNAPVLTWLRH
jgi:hypothetical protein